jgi:hypothetical protein
VGDLDAEHLLAGVGVRVEVDNADGAVLGRTGADVRLGDAVVAAATRSSSKASIFASRWGPCGQLAARIPRGP